ncbi:MAG: NAD(P)-binding protein, partial [Proteobacteria bacterium]|nr:NAD(P)-binding protein [Pseudomonadota bacterium]
SPEQAAGGEVTVASDLYSLGLVLAELFDPPPVNKAPPKAPKALKAAPLPPDTPPPHSLSTETGVDGSWLKSLENQPALPKPVAPKLTPLPKELKALAAELLQDDPQLRPSASQVAQRLQTWLDRPARRRRQALWAVLAVVVVLLVATALASMRGPNKEQVIVVGAGLSGLAAARELEDHGCCEVTVLEAQERVGGRIYTMKTPAGSILEASSQYHSGRRSSSLTPLIKKIGMKREAFTATQDSWDIDGTRTPVSQEDWDRFYSDTTGKARTLEDQPEVSLESMIEMMAADGEFSYLDNDREIGYCISALFENDHASDAGDNRAWGIWEGDELVGRDEWFPEGMSAITDHLAEGLDIRLNTPVTEVHYDEEGVTIKTATGEEFIGDRAIITVSLGVLQGGDIQFKPPLPKKNSDAINRLGMGLMNKVWLVFPEVFWDEDVNFMGYLSDPPGQ